MALEAHKLAVCDFDDVNIHGVQDMGHDPAIDVSFAGGSGEPYNTHVSVGAHRPLLTIASTDLKTIIDKVGLWFATVTTGAVFTAYWTKTADGAARAGASSHEKMVINKGILAVASFTANMGEDAQVAFAVYAVNDGTNAPVVFTANQTLLAAGNVTARWTLGPIEIAGAQLEGVQGYTVSTGVQVAVRSSDGRPSPYHGSVEIVQPSIEIRTLDASAQRTFGLSGTAISGDGVELWLRKRAQGAACVANATSEHIQFKVAAGQGTITAGPATASHPADVVSVVNVHPIYKTTGPVLPITVDTAIAIPDGL